MRWIVAALSALAILAHAAPAPAAPARNPGFEEGAVGKLPPGWFLPPTLRDAGFTAEISADSPHTGRACARVRYGGAGAPRTFGNLLQQIDAASYRGKRVRLRAVVRVVGAGSRGQLWMRVDRRGNRRGFFENMGDRPVVTPRWTEVEITGDVAEDAVAITFGLMLFGPGHADLDSVSLTVTGVALPPYEPEGPRALDDLRLSNLIAFARLFGYVRHFHPGDEAAEANWDEVAVAGVMAIEKARSSADLARRLEELFAPLAPTLRVFRRGAKTTRHAALARPEETTGIEIVEWRHVGFGQGPSPSIYKSHRTRTAIPPDGTDPIEVFEADLGRGVTCRVPMGLYADSEGTRPNVAARAAQLVPGNFVASGDDRATRLAAVVLLWNVFQHFYPYFDVVETDWPDVLERSLRAAATDRDARAFLDTLRRLVAALHDGHGHVSHLSDARPHRLPVRWTWIDEQLVVTWAPRAIEGIPGPRPGDVVVAIDGTPVAGLLTSARERISGATDQWILWRAQQDLARVASARSRTLDLLSFAEKDRKVRATVFPVQPRLVPPEKRPAVIAELEPGIWYVDLGRVKDAAFTAAVDDLAKAEGIVFDMRGYPSGLKAQTLFGHLVKKTTPSPQWHMPHVRRPDRTDLAFKRSPGWKLPAVEPYFEARRAFIIDGRAISYAESCMGIVEHEKLGALVGGPTAGTNGNVNPIRLPGGYRVSWTGMKVLKGDGSRHHGVGILPTVPVSRTRAGVAAGRDELLEKAIEAVKKK